MRVPMVLLATAASLSLAACADSMGGGPRGMGGGPRGWNGAYAYDGYYDNHYGSFYDGYWGDDGGFWYRSTDRDTRYRRGDATHFRRDAGTGAGYQHFQGNITAPPARARMPHFPRGVRPPR